MLSINTDIIFIIVIAVFVGYYLCKREGFFGLSATSDSIEGFAAIDDARQAVKEIYTADIEAIRNLSEVSKKLQAGGLTVPGDLVLNGKLRLRHPGAVDDDSDPYYLEKVRAGPNNNSLRLTINDDADESFQIWGNSCGAGNCGGAGTMAHYFGANGSVEHKGNANVSGTITAGGVINAGGAINAGSFNTGGVINAGGINTGGVINFPNGWRINTADGHFRIQHNGADKFVVHNGGLPAYTPNGLDIGIWRATGGGTLNVSGNANVVGGINANGSIRSDANNAFRTKNWNIGVCDVVPGEFRVYYNDNKGAADPCQWNMYALYAGQRKGL